MTFQFDTAGRVLVQGQAKFPILTEWSDLSPFEQGYINAAMESFCAELAKDYKTVCFGCLASETLARIMDDCERYAYEHPRHASEHGGMFWMRRQRDEWPTFPPLTVYLGNDGKIYFKS
jgi:hypothetical protein